MRKILLIASIVLMSAGAIIFLAIGTPLSNFTCMWAGLGIFLVGLVTLIVWFYLRTYLKRKEDEKNNIKRG
ncbi:MAG: hypothetical protein MJ199_00635 [Bacilli bacterium]|nr:hypothetical protein [Bacilli bacterium]